MGNSIRCCLACVLPCGALDVIRIVHLNGQIEEHSRPISAAEVLKSNPNHVLTKPCSQGLVHRILILSPESDLKRGSIYFLIPAASVPERKKKINCKSKSKNPDYSRKSTTVLPVTDQYRVGTEMEKKPATNTHRDRKRERVGIWRPRLDSISEDL